MRVGHHHRDDEGGVRRDVDKSANAAVEERKSLERRMQRVERRAKKGRSKISANSTSSSSSSLAARRRRESRGESDDDDDGGSTKTVTQAGTSKDYNASPSHSPFERANWFPVAFSKNVKFDHMIPFDLFNVPWVLLRTKSGKIGCVKDECAHRACPLSLGTQVRKAVQCCTTINFTDGVANAPP